MSRRRILREIDPVQQDFVERCTFIFYGSILKIFTAESNDERRSQN